jgi:putative hydrolase of the HAD superfamily
MITHLLLDLDNTLYSAKLGLENNVALRLEEFLSGYLNISIEESRNLHQNIVQQYGYGTTIEWLIAEKGFTDIDAYYEIINPDNEADVLSHDPHLRGFLESIPIPKAILTNSIHKHANNIIDRLGIRDQFEHIFDISYNNFRGKPHANAFFKALETMNARPETTLFVDDFPVYVEGFIKIGGNGVLFDEFDRYASFPYRRIKNLREIINFL